MPHGNNDKMRIAWFSPFPPQRSGISDYSEQIVYELRKHCEVHLWTDGAVKERLLRDFTVINYTERADVLDGLKSYDAIIYNMGNNLACHKNIFETLKKHPGTVVLHDYVLNGFFLNYLNKKDYLAKLVSFYGLKGLWWLLRILLEYIFIHKQHFFKDEIGLPFNEEVLSRAKAVVVHSDFVRDMLLKNNLSLPIVKINSPYYTSTERYSSGEKLKIDEGKILLLSIGEVVPYKQLDKIIYALAKDEILRGNSVFCIIGQPHPNTNLDYLIKKYHLQDNVRMLGYQPFETIYDYLSRADIYIGLRYPTMGETSASLIRALEQGRPCIVTNVGWYSELPDECVAKIAAPVDVEELRSVLRRLMKDRGYREALGRNARKHIHEEYSTELYVEKLLNFIEALS